MLHSAHSVTATFSPYGPMYNPYGSSHTQMQGHYAYGPAPPPYGFCAPYGPAAPPPAAHSRNASEFSAMNFRSDLSCHGANAMCMIGPPVMAPKHIAPSVYAARAAEVASSAEFPSSGAGVNLSPSTSIATTGSLIQPTQRSDDKHIEGPLGANLFGECCSLHAFFNFVSYLSLLQQFTISRTTSPMRI